jgi:hypothetical protein
MKRSRDDTGDVDRRSLGVEVEIFDESGADCSCGMGTMDMTDFQRGRNEPVRTTTRANGVTATGALGFVRIRTLSIAQSGRSSVAR